MVVVVPCGPVTATGGAVGACGGEVDVVVVDVAVRALPRAVEVVVDDEPGAVVDVVATSVVVVVVGAVVDDASRSDVVDVVPPAATRSRPPEAR